MISQGLLGVGDGVNLERAMAADSRFGGHFVQGHVDATVTIIKSIPDGNSLRLTFSLPPAAEAGDLMPYLIPKGYVTLDGASLTVTEVSQIERSFAVMLVAHTQSKITLPRKPIGGKVNLEVDMVGKYVHHSILASLAALGAASDTTEPLVALLKQIVQRPAVDQTPGSERQD